MLIDTKGANWPTLRETKHDRNAARKKEHLYIEHQHQCYNVASDVALI